MINADFLVSRGFTPFEAYAFLFKLKQSGQKFENARAVPDLVRLFDEVSGKGVWAEETLGLADKVHDLVLRKEELFEFYRAFRELAERNDVRTEPEPEIVEKQRKIEKDDLPILGRLLLGIFKVLWQIVSGKWLEKFTAFPKIWQKGGMVVLTIVVVLLVCWIFWGLCTLPFSLMTGNSQAEPTPQVVVVEQKPSVNKFGLTEAEMAQFQNGLKTFRQADANQPAEKVFEVFVDTAVHAGILPLGPTNEQIRQRLIPIFVKNNWDLNESLDKIQRGGK